MTISKEVLELFRLEIEAKVDRYKRETDRKITEMVVDLYRLDVPISHIIHATKLSEEEVLGIIDER